MTTLISIGTTVFRSDLIKSIGCNDDDTYIELLITGEDDWIRIDFEDAVVMTESFKKAIEKWEQSLRV